MALRLRRGTDAERQLITPAEGELIYTTDTKSVYIGDGTTVGGIIISGEIGLGDLAEVDLSTPPTVGQVLKWDGTQFVPDDLAAAGSGVVEGSNYRINITADDSTVIVDTATSTFTGNFVGDGSGLTNLNFSDTVSIFNLSDVFAFTPPDPNDVLMFDGINFTPQKIRQIEGFDSTVILDAETNSFRGELTGDVFGNVTGNLIGDVTGNLTGNLNGVVNGVLIGDHAGSVFSDDSSLIVDGLTGSIYTNKIITPTDTVEINSNPNTNNTFRLINTNNSINSSLSSILSFTSSSTGDLGSSSIFYGKIYFSREDTTGSTISSFILGGRDGIFFGTEPNGNINEPNYLSLTTTGVGIGKFFASAKLDVDGNAIISGDVQAAAFIGSLMTDNSTTIVDGINGNITAPGFVQFGSFTKTQRDNDISAQNGMVIYNTTSNKFQGYQNGAWINLDNGSADP